MMSGRPPTPRGQAVLMGLIFLLVFSSYLTIQGFAVQLYGEALASDMEFVLYAVFTVSCFAAPAVVNVLGPRRSLLLGVLGYAALVLASLLLATVGGPGATPAVVTACRAGVVGGGALLGLGAAVLWTAQGRLMLEWSDGTDQGALFSIFWGLFNTAAVAGGLTTFVYFSRAHVTAPAPLYIFFLGLIITGAAATQLLAPDGTPHTATAPPARQGGPGGGEALEAPLLGEARSSCGAAWRETRSTLALFGTRRMAFLVPFFFYTGFNQPYQLNTFGDRYFSAPTLGLALCLFYAFEIAGGFVAGRILDRGAPARAAPAQLALFSVLTAGGYAAAASTWRQANHAAHLSFPGDGWRLAGPAAAFCLWGLSDSQAQAYSYWVLRQTHTTGAAQARAVGFYKMVQSLGWCIGFALVPADRCPPLVQMGLTATCGAVGVALAALAMPRGGVEAADGMAAARDLCTVEDTTAGGASDGNSRGSQRACGGSGREV